MLKSQRILEEFKGIKAALNHEAMPPVMYRKLKTELSFLLQEYWAAIDSESRTVSRGSW